MDLGRGRVEAAASRGLPGAMCGLDGVEPQGDMGGGLANLIEPMQLQSWL